MFVACFSFTSCDGMKWRARLQEAAGHGSPPDLPPPKKHRLVDRQAGLVGSVHNQLQAVRVEPFK